MLDVERFELHHFEGAKSTKGSLRSERVRAQSPEYTGKAERCAIAHALLSMSSKAYILGRAFTLHRLVCYE